MIIKNKKVILPSIIIIVLIIVAIILFTIINTPNKKISARCTDTSSLSPGLIDCYGVISVHDAFDVNYLSMQDHLHNYEIARIFNINQFINDDQYVYVKNKQIIEGSTSNATSTQYFQRLFKDGELVTNYYNYTSDIPTYFVINYKTGDVAAYKNINEIPKDKKPYFEEIENRN